MGYRTTRAVSFGGRRYEDHDPIPHPDDIGGFVDALFDKARQELLDMGAIVLDADTVESLADRRNDLLRQLAEASGTSERLMVVTAPSSAGNYIMRVGPDGVSDIQPFLDIDPLADADEATIRRHHLDALRELGDDVTYLALTADATAELGQNALFDLDPDTGLVTSAASQSSAPIAGQVLDVPAAGEAIQVAGAADGAGQALPPVATDGDPTDLATMTKAQLFDEAARIGAVRAAGMSKVDLIAAIEAKRGAA